MAGTISSVRLVVPAMILVSMESGLDGRNNEAAAELWRQYQVLSQWSPA